jgi:hypothetical protein
LRSTLASSPLVRLLGDPAPGAPEATGMDFAERLSLWLGPVEAIELQSAHQAIRGQAAAPVRPQAATTDAREDVQRVRSVLARLVARELPADECDEPGYAAFHERHLELQRQMDLMVPPLRQHLREALARTSPALRQLAALDAAMAQALAAREQARLPQVGKLLQRRFARWRAAAADGGEDLASFTRGWREALLAELDLRLAPCVGLAEALVQETRNPR